MSRTPKNILKLPMEERALLALKDAVKEAIAERTREGLPVYVWKDGKVVDLNAHKSRISPKRSPRRKTAAKKQR
jgi:hypothetical protein